MEIRLIQGAQLLPEADALLVPGEGAADWLGVLKDSGLPLHRLEAFPIPGATANSLAGCLLRTKLSRKSWPPRCTGLQLLAGVLYIPEGAQLWPSVAEDELRSLLKNRLHFLHPSLGLVALEEALHWDALLKLPGIQTRQLITPPAPVFLPSRIRVFEVQPEAPDDVLQALDEKAVPEKGSLEEKPLRLGEKIKLQLYRLLFGKKDAKGKAEAGAKPGGIAPALNRFGIGGGERQQKLEADHEDLERRNASELDKLLEMLRTNPEEALKYAIPLDDGRIRGSDSGAGYYQLRLLRSSFSLFGSSNRRSSGGGGGITADDAYQKLHLQYMQTAQALIAAGDYEKAAFVYLRLLKDAMSAANTLEGGGLFAEAAAVHLKYTKNKGAAASCYEKGRMYREALPLYEELGQNEKAGDMCLLLDRRDAAMAHYTTASNQLGNGSQFLKAAALCREKMNDGPAADNWLLTGWRRGTDGYNCLHTYFLNQTDERSLQRSIDTIYRTEVQPKNARDFLRVLRHEADRSDAIHSQTRQIAVELVSSLAGKDPGAVSELRHFNAANRHISKDILRYRGR